MNDASPVTVERIDEVAVVRLNRPQRLNALDPGLREGLISAMTEVNADSAVRAVVLTGAGTRAFSVGLDMEVSVGLDPATVEPWLRGLQRYFQSIRDLDKPVVAAVNGVAMGLGLQTALHCDVRIAHRGVMASQPEIRAGVPSVLGHMVLATIVGHARAVELSLSVRSVAATEGERLGIWHRLVAADRLHDEALERARGLGAQPATATRLSKQYFRAVTQSSFDDAVEWAIRLQREAYASGEPHAFAASFLARTSR